MVPSIQLPCSQWYVQSPGLAGVFNGLDKSQLRRKPPSAGNDKVPKNTKPAYAHPSAAAPEPARAAAAPRAPAPPHSATSLTALLQRANSSSTQAAGDATSGHPSRDPSTGAGKPAQGAEPAAAVKAASGAKGNVDDGSGGGRALEGGKPPLVPTNGASEGGLQGQNEPTHEGTKQVQPLHRRSGSNSGVGGPTNGTKDGNSRVAGTAGGAAEKGGGSGREGSKHQVVGTARAGALT
eukprot:389955-Pelagomonas_calceolata.AAC.2